MNTLSVLVTTSPNNHLSATALDYIEAALKNGVELVGIFFYQDGVMHANKNIQIPNDEFQPILHWQRLKQAYTLPLHLCVSAAEKRGMSDENADSIHSIFTISGLGELVDLLSKADRMVQF